MSAVGNVGAKLGRLNLDDHTTLRLGQTLLGADILLLDAQQQFEFGGTVNQEKPILGGDTAITLSSAPTLATLGVSVKGLGTAKISGSGAATVADFRITGGSTGPSGTEILHQGSGLELSDAAGAVRLQGFLIDTRNHIVDANVTVNGKSAGNVAVFNIGADGHTLTLTQAAAAVVNETLGTTALTTSTVIGSAAPAPLIDPSTLGIDQIRPLFSGGPNTQQPILGGDTAIQLTAAGTLAALGVTVSGLGTAKLDTSGPTPVADFAITGGTEGPNGYSAILHQGSGLELKDHAGTLDLRDFLIDTRNGVVNANVATNGKSVGNLAVFSVGADGASLKLTAAAAAAVNATLGTTALNTSITIGVANPQPATVGAFFSIPSPLF